MVVVIKMRTVVVLMMIMVMVMVRSIITSPFSITGRNQSSSSALTESSNSIGNDSAPTAGHSGSLSLHPVADVVQKIDVNPPKGTRDFHPEEMRLRSLLFHNFREVLQMFGFEEIDFPVLESEALFIQNIREEIKDQLYCFEDMGNQRVALRPELTHYLVTCVKELSGQISQICGDEIEITMDGEVFVACNACAVPVCRPC